MIVEIHPENLNACLPASWGRRAITVNSWESADFVDGSDGCGVFFVTGLQFRA